MISEKVFEKPIFLCGSLLVVTLDRKRIQGEESMK